MILAPLEIQFSPPRLVIYVIGQPFIRTDPTQAPSFGILDLGILDIDINKVTVIGAKMLQDQ